LVDKGVKTRGFSGRVLKTGGTNMKAWMVRTVAAVFCVSFLAAALVSAEEAGPAEPEKKDDEYQKFLEGWKEQVKIQMEAKMREAEYYLASGKKRFEERLYEEAERDFKQALAANGNLVEAREYLARTQRVLGVTPAGERDILEGETARIRARMGFQRANMVQAVADARQLMRDKNYGTALSKLDEARNLAKVLATQIDVSQEMGEINALTDQATVERDKAVKEEEQRKLEDAKRVAEAEHARLKDLQDQRIQRLFEDAKQLFADGRYMAAAKRVEEILKIEPRNREAIAFRARAYEAQVAEDVKWYAKTEEQETAATWHATRVQSIPYYEVQPLYPAD